MQSFEPLYIELSEECTESQRDGATRQQIRRQTATYRPLKPKKKNTHQMHSVEKDPTSRSKLSVKENQRQRDTHKQQQQKQHSQITKKKKMNKYTTTITHTSKHAYCDTI